MTADGDLAEDSITDTSLVGAILLSNNKIGVPTREVNGWMTLPPQIFLKEVQKDLQLWFR